MLTLPLYQIAPMESDGMSRVYQMLYKSAVSKDFRQIGVLFAKKLSLLRQRQVVRRRQVDARPAPRTSRLARPLGERHRRLAVGEAEGRGYLIQCHFTFHSNLII